MLIEYYLLSALVERAGLMIARTAVLKEEDENEVVKFSHLIRRNMDGSIDDNYMASYFINMKGANLGSIFSKLSGSPLGKYAFGIVHSFSKLLSRNEWDQVMNSGKYSSARESGKTFGRAHIMRSELLIHTYHMRALFLDIDVSLFISAILKRYGRKEKR